MLQLWLMLLLVDRPPPALGFGTCHASVIKFQFGKTRHFRSPIGSKKIIRDDEE